LCSPLNTTTTDPFECSSMVCLATHWHPTCPLSTIVFVLELLWPVPLVPPRLFLRHR
jgi:hypothetical protein